jgi:hypothetical protein
VCLCRWSGVDHIYLTDNNSGQGEELLRQLASEFPASFLTLRTELAKHAQLKSYAWCAEEHRVKYNWMGFFDLDEFLVLHDSYAHLLLPCLRSHIVECSRNVETGCNSMPSPLQPPPLSAAVPPPPAPAPAPSGAKKSCLKHRPRTQACSTAPSATTAGAVAPMLWRAQRLRARGAWAVRVFISFAAAAGHCLLLYTAASSVLCSSSSRWEWHSQHCRCILGLAVWLSLPHITCKNTAWQVQAGLAQLPGCIQAPGSVVCALDMGRPQRTCHPPRDRRRAALLYSL